MTRNTIDYIRKLLITNRDNHQNSLLLAIESNYGETAIQNAIKDYRAAFKAFDEFEDAMGTDDDCCED